MQRFLSQFIFILIAFVLASIDIIFNWDINLISDRVNYLNHVAEPYNDFYSVFSFFNFEFIWYRILIVIKSFVPNSKENFVLRIVTFFSTWIFLQAFRRRTSSIFLPIFIIFMPGVIEFYVVKLRHGLALSIFAYLSTFKSFKLKNIFYLVLCSIHSSFLLSNSIYIFGTFMKKLNLEKSKKLFLNIAFLFGGMLFSIFILEMMQFFGIRQYGYISQAVQNADFSGFGLYRISIFIIILSLSCIKIKSYDSQAVLYSTSFFLGFSFVSFIGGRFLSTFLPFLIAELLISKSELNKFIFWFLRLLVISLFTYGWFLNFSKPGFGFLNTN
tara:strand:- start:576 stop:1559 length:984 start_codon:yes stop_codon:yes gene_type:complete